MVLYIVVHRPSGGGPGVPLACAILFFFGA